MGSRKEEQCHVLKPLPRDTRGPLSQRYRDKRRSLQKKKRRVKDNVDHKVVKGEDGAIASNMQHGGEDVNLGAHLSRMK